MDNRNKSAEIHLRLSPDQLYKHCNLSSMKFESTLELGDDCEHLGQERALEALKFGIGIKHDGYNLYVLGSTGLGKNTTVKKILEKELADSKRPDDWCYINNFSDPHKPDFLNLPCGRAKQLRQDMLHLIEDLLTSISLAFESDEYTTRAQAIQDEIKGKEEAVFNKLTEKADKKGVTLLRTPGGYTLAPMKDNKVLSPEEFEKLDEDEQKKIKDVINEIEQDLVDTIRQIPVWHKEHKNRIKQLDRETSEIIVNQLISDLNNKYSDQENVLHYISSAQLDIIENINDFRKYSTEKRNGNSTQAIDQAFSRYKVNVLVDNSEATKAPVIYEDNPNLHNLIGRIEHIAQFGTLLTDFSLIKAGALHRANGGYLVLDVRKVLMSPFSWEALKRSIHAHEVRIESLEHMLSLASTTTLQPKPIPIDVKVILTGSRLLYYLLKEYDPEFGLLFKVPADFSEDIDRNEENSELYAQLISSLQKQHKLKPFTKKGVERIIEHCSRLLDDSEKLSLHMGNLTDLLKECDYWAEQNKHSQITHSDIQKVIDTRHYRLDQLRERVHEQITRGNYLLDTSGEKVAQINGLSIIQLSDYSFGRPIRITATARLGTGKVIDIERESKLGGSIHSKGVMIISSYLANRYARNQQMSLSASLVFEQSYNMVEGDSASAAELCALLSALSDIPIKQSFSVTGSINQYGEIQPIGGVNEKIEGFFDICKARKLTGEQAVIIPESNVKHLMLRSDVRDAVKKNKFSIYSVTHIDQIMELLTGKEAGEADINGIYPKGSINYLVQQRVNKLNQLRKEESTKKTEDKTGFTRKHDKNA